MDQIIFATGNKAKLEQASFVAEQLGLHIQIINGRKAYGDDVEYDEIGDSTEAIARDGALNVAKRIGQPVIAEDTDFYVDALGGFPGIRGGLFLKTFGRKALHDMMQHQTNRACHITSSCSMPPPTATFTAPATPCVAPWHWPKNLTPPTPTGLAPAALFLAAATMLFSSLKGLTKPWPKSAPKTPCKLATASTHLAPF